MADIHGVPDASMVTPVQGMDIQAPQQDLTSMLGAATAISGPGGPRQAATEVLLASPQGFAVGSGDSGYDIAVGYSGHTVGNEDGWPSNAQP